MLDMVGIKYTLLDTEVDEDNHFADDAEEYVMSLSEKKARRAAVMIKEGIIAAADTIVYVDGRILNKPIDAQDARRMLTSLSGRTHTVYTGFTLLEVPGGRLVRQCGATEVTFRTLEAEEIEEYIESGSPFDKAGAYGIQDDLSALFVERINGDFYNVVGLPLPKFYLALKKFTRAGVGM